MGDGTVGLGHLTRTAAVATELVARGHDVTIVAQTTAHLTHFADVSGATFHRVDHPERTWPLLHDLLDDDAPTVVVVDLIGFRHGELRRLRASGPAAVVTLASDGLESVDADLAVVDDPLLVDERPPAAMRVAIGLDLHVVRPSVLSARPSEPWQGDRARRVLLALGGADPELLTESLVRRLLRSKADIDLAAVIGAAWPLGRERASVADWRGRVIVHARPTDLADALLAADLVVTLGGRTTHEALALGRPVVCPSWRHMGRYVAALAATGLVTDLGPDLRDATRRIIELAGRPAPLHDAARAGFAAIDGGAAGRVASLCESVMR